MTNNQIADKFSLLSKLMDIKGEDSFKAKSYSSVAFAIENLAVELHDIAPEKYASLKGIGASSAKKITELLATGSLLQLEETIASIPPGVIEMLRIKGLGPKKINTVWREMEINSVGELQYACEENRLSTYKGFGAKTQQTILENIEFFLKSKGNWLYAQTIPVTEQLHHLFISLFPGKRIFVTGDHARQSELINVLAFVIEEDFSVTEETLRTQAEFSLANKTGDHLLFDLSPGIKIKIYPVTENVIEKLVETSSSPEFFKALQTRFPHTNGASDEHEFFRLRDLNHVPAFLREDPAVLSDNSDRSVHLQPENIKGLIHCHSTWSDGSNTIEELARAAIERGMEYMAISDHSRTAIYAKGLREEQIRAQHGQIDELNHILAPFRIFKSIESDILGDGSLDYSPAVLKTFDLVIASVHSNLTMTHDKAMARLIVAIENPYTTILGHMSGRLLLSRPGYPLNHKRIIDACAANNVVIELNANPNRLDMDWRYINYAIKKGVLISIDPDAHSIKGIDDIKYGIFSAQKAMLTKENNLSSFPLKEFETFIVQRKFLKSI